MEYSNSPDILELTSTILFYFKGEIDEKANQFIRRLKPEFTDQQYENSLRLAEQLNQIRRR